MVINDFVSAMQSKDHEALAACFAEECRLFDYCPSVVKRRTRFCSAATPSRCTTTTSSCSEASACWTRAW